MNTKTNKEIINLFGTKLAAAKSKFEKVSNNLPTDRRGEAALKWAHSVMAAEHEMLAWLTIEGQAANLRYEEDMPVKVMAQIGRSLAYGADDTWSGRTNDAQRIAFDARRLVADRALDILTYGS